MNGISIETLDLSEVLGRIDRMKYNDDGAQAKLAAIKGFERHVQKNLSTVASSVHEATSRYLGWDMYWHNCENGAC